MNFASNESVTPIERIQAVALRQKMFNCASLRNECRSSRTITPFQCGGSSAGVISLVGILDPAIALRTKHPRTEVRQVEPSACDGNGQGVAGVQAEEPNTRLPIADDVCAHVQFGECREPWHRGRPPQANIRHSKRDDGEPRPAVERINFQPFGNQRSQFCGIDRPMRKEEVVPTLGHHPRARRQRPRPVRNVVQYFLQKMFQLLLDSFTL